MICAIVQPTFLPWLGWFDLADQVDMLVVLDDVAFSKQSWQQRNRIRGRDGLEFLSVPVKTAGRLGQTIMECELVEQPFVAKMINALRANYGKSAFFASVIDELSAVMEAGARTGRLVELNCALIAWMAARLGVDTAMVRASTLETGGQRGEHVARICERIGATDYLSPPGAEEYLIEDRTAFDLRSIAMWLHVFEHPQYPQRFSPFIPYATALDLIFNVGPDAAAVMRSGRRPARPLQENQKGAVT
jgi:hypothetical protein